MPSCDPISQIPISSRIPVAFLIGLLLCALPVAAQTSSSDGLDLAASSPSHLAGTFTHGGTLLRFEARHDAGPDVEERFSFTLRDREDVELISGSVDRGRFRLRVLDGVETLEGRTDAAGEVAPGSARGEVESEALETAVRHDEYRILPYLSRTLGSRGITGRTHPASLALHVLGLGAAEYHDIELEPIEPPASSTRPELGEQPPGTCCFDQTGDPCVDDCFGMCGKDCSCWWWVCDGCCIYTACLEHDGYCSACECNEGSCWLCYVPITVFFGACEWQTERCTNDAACNAPVAIEAPVAVTNSPVASWVQQGGHPHVYYLHKTEEKGLHVIELYWAGSVWTAEDVTDHSNGLPADSASPLAALGDDAGHSHLYFLGTDDHVHELYWDGNQWWDYDITQQSDAPSARVGSALVSFLVGGKPHVYFQDGSNDVQELYYDGGVWKHNNVTGAAGVEVAAEGTALAGFAANPNGSPHVYYRGTDDHVYELYWNGDDGRWIGTDLTKLVGAPAARSDTALTGFASSSNPRVYYVDGDGDVIELYYIPGSWGFNDLRYAQPSSVAPGSALAGVAVEGNSPRVYYFGTDHSLIELWYTGPSGFDSNNLTTETGAPQTSAIGALSGALASGNPQVYYESLQSIVELFYANQEWNDTRVTDVFIRAEWVERKDPD